MVKIRESDSKNKLWFTEGYIAPLEKHQPLYTNGRPEYRKFRPEFPDLDESAAWVLSAAARRSIYAERWNYGGFDAWFEIPVETWILGHSKEGRLAAWFENKAADTNYRLIINKMPCQNGDIRLGTPWYHVYTRLKRVSGNREPLIHNPLHHVDRTRRENTISILQQLLAAYRVNEQEKFVASLGHPYCVSTGLPVRGA